LPRLVLFEDDGREVFRGDISRGNFIALEAFLARHRYVITSSLAVFGPLKALLGLVAEPGPPPPSRVKPAPARKRGGRA
jgi:hypothetical protein